MRRVPGRTSGSVAALLLSVATATACSGDASTPARPEPSVSRGDAVEGLRFGDCGDVIDLSVVGLPADRADRLTFSCGTLRVPLDHARPGGQQLGIQVVRIRDATQHDRIGSLVMNPGGPGQSGVDYVPSWAAWLPDEILARFDVVTYDPRGVARSGGFNCPAIPEDSEPTVLADIRTKRGYAFARKVSEEQATSCLGELGADRIGHIGTVATARDMDLLRQALGDERLTFVGFSYGAKLGAEYARQFPDRIRALVLDSPSDPGHDPIGIVERQATTFEEAFNAWADGCAERPSCDRLGDARELVRRLMARARRMPIPSGRPGDDVPASDTTVISVILALLRFESFWPTLDDVLGEAALGDSGSLQEVLEQQVGIQRDPEKPEPGDAQLTINCTDAAPGPAKGAIQRAARRIMAANPVVGKAVSFWLVGCKYWLGDRDILPVPRDVGAPPILVLGSRHDPVTPYTGAVAMARILGSGHLLTWNGKTHTSYGQSACVNSIVDRYLLDLRLPAEGTVCPA
jgi:pimeloyl-ACP methyl ester carboxylesterase